MLLADFLNRGIEALEPLYPTAEARSIMLMLCEAFIGTKSYTHIVEPRYPIAPEWEQPLEEALLRLRSGEPIQYVTGHAEFCGRRFRVNRDVLIPRPETELLVQEAVKAAGNTRQLRVLDLCTGSGNIAWSLALSLPGSRVVGVDISEKALEVARSQDFSAECARTGALPPTFVAADILDTEQEFDYGSFDLILSNPPYIMEREKALMRRNVLSYEPSAALFVPDDDPLLFYRAVARWSERFLVSGGKGLTEINEALGAGTLEVFRSPAFSQAAVRNDFYGKNRFIFYEK